MQANQVWLSLNITASSLSFFLLDFHYGWQTYYSFFQDSQYSACKLADI